MEIKNAFISFLKERVVGFGIFLFVVLLYVLWGIYWSNYNRYHEFVEKHRTTDYKWVANDSLKTMELIYVGDSTDYPVDLIEYEEMALGSRISEFVVAPVVAIGQFFSDTTALEAQNESSVEIPLSAGELLVVLSSAAQKYSQLDTSSDALSSVLLMTSQSQEPNELPFEIPAWDQFEVIDSEALVKEKAVLNGEVILEVDIEEVSSKSSNSSEGSVPRLSNEYRVMSVDEIDSLVLHNARMYAITLHEELLERIVSDSLIGLLSSSEVRGLSSRGGYSSYQAASLSVQLISSAENASVTVFERPEKNEEVSSGVQQSEVIEVVPLWRFAIDTVQQLGIQSSSSSSSSSSRIIESSHQLFISSSLTSSEPSVMSSELSSSIGVLSSVEVAYFQDSIESNEAVSLPSFSRRSKIFYYKPLAREWISEFADWLRYFLWKIEIPEIPEISREAVYISSYSLIIESSGELFVMSSVERSLAASSSIEVAQDLHERDSVFEVATIPIELLLVRPLSSLSDTQKVDVSSVSEALSSSSTLIVLSSVDHFTGIVEIEISSYVQESKDSFVVIDTTRWWNTAILSVDDLVIELRSIFTFGKTEMSDSSQITREKKRDTLVRALYDHVILSSSALGVSSQEVINQGAEAREILQERKRSRLRQLVVRSREEMRQKRLTFITDSLYSDSLYQDSVAVAALKRAQRQAIAYEVQLDSLVRQHDSLEQFLINEFSRMDSAAQVIQASQSKELSTLDTAEGRSGLYDNFINGVRTIVASVKSTAVSNIEKPVEDRSVHSDDFEGIDSDFDDGAEMSDEGRVIDGIIDEIVTSSSSKAIAIKPIGDRVSASYFSLSSEIRIKAQDRLSAIDSVLGFITQQMKDGALKPRKKSFIEPLEFGGEIGQRSGQNNDSMMLSSEAVLMTEESVGGDKRQVNVEYFVVGHDIQSENGLLKGSSSENVSDENRAIEWIDQSTNEELFELDVVEEKEKGVGNQRVVDVEGVEIQDEVVSEMPVELIEASDEDLIEVVETYDLDEDEAHDQVTSLEIVPLQPTQEELNALKRAYEADSLLNYVKGSIADSVARWVRIDIREQIRLDSLQVVADSIQAFKDSLQLHMQQITQMRSDSVKELERLEEEAKELESVRIFEEREARKQVAVLKAAEEERAREQELALVLALAEKERVEKERIVERTQEKAKERARIKALKDHEAQKQVAALKVAEEERAREKVRVLAQAEKDRIERERTAQLAQVADSLRVEKEALQRAYVDSIAKKVEEKRVEDSLDQVKRVQLQSVKTRSSASIVLLSSDGGAVYRGPSVNEAVHISSDYGVKKGERDIEDEAISVGVTLHSAVDSLMIFQDSVALRADSILQFVKRAIADSVSFWVETSKKLLKIDKNKAENGENVITTDSDDESGQGELLEVIDENTHKSHVDKKMKTEEVEQKKNGAGEKESKQVVEKQGKKLNKRYRYVLKNFKCDFGVASKVYAEFDLELLFFDKKLKYEIKRSSDNIKAITQNIFYFTSKDKMQLPLIQKRLTQKMHYLYQKDIEVRFKNFETKIKNETSP
ncbi:MAG: hypothetical protein OCC49_11620 [Fibrobacterales bacterium]